MTAYQRLRISRGLHWQSKFPPFPWRLLQVSVVAACVAAVLLHIEELEARTAVVANHWTGALADCLNGTYRATAADGTQIACLPAETFNPKRKS